MVKFDHLRINCQKILPAVYGDSLSYYETLCKLQKAVNDLVDYLANFEDEILMKHLRDLKNYIDRELSMIQGQLDLVKSDLQGVKQTISINIQTINAKIAQIELDLAQKQNQYAPGLATVNKTIEGAINEMFAILLTKYTFPEGGIPLEDLSPELQQLLEEIPYLLIDKADVIIDSAGPANPLSITDGGNDLPLESMTVNVEPIQDPAPYISDTADQDPYNFRAFPAAASGANLEYETIVGGSVVWNQYISTAGITSRGVTSAFSSGVWSFSGLAEGTYFNFGGAFGTNGHKYLALWKIVANPNNVVVTQMRALNNSTGITSGDDWTIYSATGSGSFGMVTDQAYNMDGFKAQVICVDLTTMFGTTVANSMTAELFRSYFPNAYYVRTLPAIQSVSVSEKMITGINQWDEEWVVGSIDLYTGVLTSSTIKIRSKNYIKVLPSTNYYFKFGGSLATWYVFFYDGNNNFIDVTSNISNVVFTTPANCRYIMFREAGNIYGTTYNNNICINISNPAINGTYYPHTASTYALSHTELRGIPSIVDSKLVYDGDDYSSSGRVVRKYAEVDLGDFTYDSGNNNFSLSISSATAVGFDGKAICSCYPKSSVNNIASQTDKSYIVRANTIYIKDTSYSDTASFVTANGGQKLIYELQTPTTDSVTPYTNPQAINLNGTESFTDYLVSQSTRDVAIPVGHITYYGLESGISANTQVDITNTTDDGSETYTVQLPYPSYGGTLDPLSGLYISKFDIVDFGDLTWYYNSTYKRFSAAIDNAEGFPLDSVAPVYASGYVKTSVNDLNSDITMNGVIAVNNAGSVFVRNLSFDDAATFKNAMQGQKIVYESMDSVSFAVTPVEINTALGNNSFSTGTGTISIEYRADTKLYIDNKINALMALISEL